MKFAFLLGWLFATGAHAETCQTFVGKTVKPLTFGAAIAAVPKIAPKGEFETSAQYQARRTATLTGSAGTLLIRKTPEDRKYIVYDADAAVLNVQSYALDNSNMSAWHIIYDAGYNNKIPVDTLYNIDTVINQKDVPTGSYESQNAFGAKAHVTKITRTMDAIFDREAKNYEDRLFTSELVAKVLASPTEAKLLKETMSFAFVVVPKDPYVIKGQHSVGKTTIDNPIDITERYTLLIGDIQCGLILDAGDKVIAATDAN